VHEDDVVAHYDILKIYLTEFAADKLPSCEDHQAGLLWFLVLFD